MFMGLETQTSTINPVFAGYAAQQLQEAVGGIQRVFDNLLEIARGNDPDANGYDRIRATRVLYDRGFGKASRHTPQPPQSEKSNNHKNHSSDNQKNHSSDTPSEGGEPALSAAERKPVLSLSKGRRVADS